MHMCKRLGLQGPKLVYYTFGNFDTMNVHGHRSNSPAKMCKQLGGGLAHLFICKVHHARAAWAQTSHVQSQSRHVAKSQRSGHSNALCNLQRIDNLYIYITYLHKSYPYNPGVGTNYKSIIHGYFVFRMHKHHNVKF